MKILRLFEFSGQNLSNSLCQFLNNESILLQILYPSSISWKITPLYLFSSNNIYFAHKEPIKLKIFETFERSGQNLSNSLRQFWNNKSIPLQILHPPSFSWKRTPLYFFSSNNIYFAEKEPIKVEIFETFWVLGLKFVKFLMLIFKQRVGSSPKFVSLFNFRKDYSSVLF